MDGQAASGWRELLAISHNANLSDGWMYPTEVDLQGPADRPGLCGIAHPQRALIEIKQIKGQSETHPLLSPNDEFANYEVMSYLIGGPEGPDPADSGIVVPARRR